jgi:hypothetical protein
MPYKSERQKAWAHTAEGIKALGGPEKVAEWDKASEGLVLPERTSEKKKVKEKAPRRSSGIRWV